MSAVVVDADLVLQGDNWPEHLLSELIEDAIGGAWGVEPDKARTGQEIVRVIRGTEFKNWRRDQGSTSATRALDLKSLQRRALQNGDMVIEISGGGPSQPVGRTLVVDDRSLEALGGNVVTSNFCRRVRFKKHVNPWFIDYALKHRYFLGELNQFQTETTNIRNLTFPKFINETTIPLPTLEKQNEIVKRVEELTEQVSFAKQRLVAIPLLLKKFRQSVLAAACSGQLTAEWRGSETTPDWQHLEAQNVCEKVQSGSTPKEGFVSKSVVPFLKVYNLVDQRLAFDYKPQFISDSVFATTSMSRSTALPGDVLMNIVGPPLGKVAIVTDQYPVWTFNQALTAFRPSGRVSTEWLYLILCSGLPYEDILMQTRGSAGQSNISLTQCREMVLPIPPTDEQAEIVRRVESLFAFADSIESRLAEATVQVERTTHAILAKALRGELGGSHV